MLKKLRNNLLAFTIAILIAGAFFASAVQKRVNRIDSTDANMTNLSDYAETTNTEIIRSKYREYTDPNDPNVTKITFPLKHVYNRQEIDGRSVGFEYVGGEDLHIDMDIITTLESDGNSTAYNKESGARGLCQIQEETWNECTKLLGVDWEFFADVNDPVKNKCIGNFYINNRIPRMLAYYGLYDYKPSRLSCYNWGIGNVNDLQTRKQNKWKEHVPDETSRYINDYKNLESMKRELKISKGK